MTTTTEPAVLLATAGRRLVAELEALLAEHRDDGADEVPGFVLRRPRPIVGASIDAPACVDPARIARSGQGDTPRDSIHTIEGTERATT